MHLDIEPRVHPAVDVHHVVIGERPHHLADDADPADVGQELRCPARRPRTRLSRCSAMSTNVTGAGTVFSEPKILGEFVQPGSGKRHHTLIGLDGRERIVRRQHVVPCQRVEKGRLADIGETDDSRGSSSPDSPESKVADDPQRVLAAHPQFPAGAVDCVEVSQSEQSRRSRLIHRSGAPRFQGCRHRRSAGSAVRIAVVEALPLTARTATAASAFARRRGYGPQGELGAVFATFYRCAGLSGRGGTRGQLAV